MSQSEFQNPSFNIPPFLSQIYLWIMGLHVLVIIILANLFDASIALQTSTVISLAIAVHALTVWLRYLISRRQANQLPAKTKVAPYTIGDDGEIDHIIGEGEHLLNVDGKVEKANHD